MSLSVCALSSANDAAQTFIDLYNAIGFHRHGKTEFYRDFIAHLRKSSDRFVVAEGRPEW